MHTESETYIIPGDIFEEKELQPGDIIKVTGRTSDGDLEVVCEHKAEKEKPWQEDLEDSMPESFGGRMKNEGSSYG